MFLEISSGFSNLNTSGDRFFGIFHSVSEMRYEKNIYFHHLNEKNSRIKRGGRRAKMMQDIMDNILCHHSRVQQLKPQ